VVVVLLAVLVAVEWLSVLSVPLSVLLAVEEAAVEVALVVALQLWLASVET